MDNIKFRPLGEQDLFQMRDWLNTDFVMEWYGKKPVTIEEVKGKYMPYILGEKPTKAYIIVINNEDAGYIQTYLIID